MSSFFEKQRKWNCALVSLLGHESDLKDNRPYCQCVTLCIERCTEMGVCRLCFLLYHPVNADLSEELYTTEVQRDGGLGNEAKHSKAYEVFTVGQAKCITYINSMYPQVVGLMTVFIIQMKKWSRVVKALARDHTTREEQSWDLNLSSLVWEFISP